MPASHFDVNSMTGRPKFSLRHSTVTGKKVSHHLNVSVIKALITHLNFDVTEK
jgi:hypothetical protein